MHRAGSLGVVTLVTLVTLGLTTLAAVFVGAIRADVVPDDIRELRYRMEIENLADFQAEWGFLIRPSSSSSVAYVVEPGVGVSRLAQRPDWNGDGSHLLAVPRAEFEALVRAGTQHAYGDHGAMVTMVAAPSSFVESDERIWPPPPVPISSSRVAVERTYRIASVSMERFDLELVRQVFVHRNGQREVQRGVQRRRRR